MDNSMVKVSTAHWLKSGRRLACILLVVLSHQLAAQEIPSMQLDAPILPGEMAGSPTAQATTMTSASEVPVGSSLSPDAMQSNFVGCPSCGSVGCGGCDEFGPGYQCPPGLGLWIRADYLIWYEKDSDVLPLVTTSTGFPAAPEQLMTLDAEETQVLFGDQEVDDNPNYGWRLEVGTWLDAAATYGIMGRYTGLDGRNIDFSAGPDDFNFLGIPFFDPDIGAEDALNLTVPNERRGQVAVNLSGDMKTWEILIRRLAETGSNYRLDWLYGYRNFSLDETLQINASTLVTDPSAGILNTLIELDDRFDVENQFHGIDLGFTGHSHQGCWSMDFLLKVALGVVEHEVDVRGQQLISIPGLDPTRNVGGLFSQESNIGKTDETDFAVIPEFDLNLGYGLTPNLDFTVGYTFIYMSSVVRAGTVVDRTVDPGLAADLDPINSNRPLLNMGETGYFVHGLNLGLTGRF